ncbi:unnamed protein product, partial [Mesorhabditis spiculigera]
MAPPTPKSKKPQPRKVASREAAPAVTPPAKKEEKPPQPPNASTREFVKLTLGLGLSGLRAKWVELKPYAGPNKAITAFTANPDKNRYQDTVCLEETRVKITPEEANEGDYIHANWVKMDNRETWIATQAPTDATIVDFWRMCWEHEVVNIVQLCRLVENGKNKCAAYWPDEPGLFQNHGRFFVNNKKKEKQEGFTAMTIELLPDGCSNSRIIRLIQMPDWPDHGHGDELNKGQTVMHCSAGVSRTGTIMLIHWIKTACMANESVDPFEMFKKVRDQRACSVQTEQQFLFIFATCLEWVDSYPSCRKNFVTTLSALTAAVTSGNATANPSFLQH